MPAAAPVVRVGVVDHRSFAMSLIYLDMIKHAVPVSVRQLVGDSSAQYIVFGSYDLLHYTLPKKGDSSGLKWIEKLHENRHDLDWNYERHPLCLYCLDSTSNKKINDIFMPKTYPSCPLVLTLVRLVKYPLLQCETDFETVLESLERHIQSLLGEPDLEFIVCWNLGNADFAIVSRPMRLEQLRNLYLSLEGRGFDIEGIDGSNCVSTKFCSLSSYCAFPIDKDSKDVVRRESLGKWLSRDKKLDFINFVDWLPNKNVNGDTFKESRFLFGDRDYHYIKKRTDGELMSTAESVFAILNEMLNTEHGSSVMNSTLIPFLPMDGDNTVDENAVMDTYDMNWGDLERQMDLVSEAIDCFCEATDQELSAIGAPIEAKERCLKQLTHCKNTLLALHRHAIRLYAAAYQDDVLWVVERLYDALADTLHAYYMHTKGQTNKDGAGCFSHAVPVVYRKVMSFVSELQHVYTVLAISPHSYMETYYASMRTLNASSKLWVSYSGAIRALCELFPVYDQPLKEGAQSRGCEVLLVPYRERRSESKQMFPGLYTSNLLVLLQLNYPMMFDTKQSLFVIAHELGHYVFNTTRRERFDFMLKTMVSGVLINSRLSDALEYPLLYLSTVMTHGKDGGAEALEGYKESLRKGDKYRELLRLNVCDDLAADESQALYDALVSELGNRYARVVDEKVTNCAKEFEEWYVSDTCDDPFSETKYGRHVAQSIVAYTSEQLPSIMESVMKGIIAQSAAFLKEIDDGELDCCKSVQFDRYMLARLRAYWETRQECGRGGNDFSISSSDKLESWCSTALDIFRETHADIFACKVIGYSIDDYLEHISKFADSDPDLISSYRDLIRIMAVCETAFEGNGHQDFFNWIRDGEECPYEASTREKAIERLGEILAGPHYKYLCEYGRCVAKSIDEQIKRIKKTAYKKSLFDDIHNFAFHIEKSPKYMWRFWVHAMLRSEVGNRGR